MLLLFGNFPPTVFSCAEQIYRNLYVSLQLHVQNAVPRSTLCWKIGNISGSIELFAL